MSWLDLDDCIEEMAEEMIVEAKKVGASTALYSLTEKAPVLSGNLMANTIVTVNAPTFNTNSLTDKSGLQTFKAGMAAVNHAKAYDQIYIQNNTEYNYQIEFLGYSKNKAPDGYFRISVENMYRVMEVL